MHGKLIPILLLSSLLLLLFFYDDIISMTCRCICCSGGSRPSDMRWGGGGHPDPEISRGTVSKIIFLALLAFFLI